MTMTLEPGDILLLYSDGLVERRDRSLDEGLRLLASAAGGISDPESSSPPCWTRSARPTSEDDTCLVALRVL